MSTKSVGKFGLVQKILDENGETKAIRARITDDIVLKKGQTVFFNDFIEDVKGLVGKIDNYTDADANERIAKRKELDEKYNQETVYSLRAGSVPEEKTDKL